MHSDFGGRLDYLTDDMCQMNTRIGCIARRQAHIGGYGPSFFPSPECLLVSPFEDDEDDVSAMKRWRPLSDLPFVICDKKGGVVLVLRVVLYLGGELV